MEWATIFELEFIRKIKKFLQNCFQKRNEESRYSLRCSPVPAWRSSKDAIYIGGASWSRPAAPYSIVTAPKKGRPTRSCPGGVIVPPSRPMVNVASQHVVQQNGLAFFCSPGKAHFHAMTASNDFILFQFPHVRLIPFRASFDDIPPNRVTFAGKRPNRHWSLFSEMIPVSYDCISYMLLKFPL